MQLTNHQAKYFAYDLVKNVSQIVQRNLGLP